MRLALPQTEESVKCSSYRLTPSTNIDVKHPTLIQVCVHFSLKKCGGGGGGGGAAGFESSSSRRLLSMI